MNGGARSIASPLALRPRWHHVPDRTQSSPAASGVRWVPRYQMLETIREFGWEQLTTSGEAETVRRAHATWCVALAKKRAGVVGCRPDRVARSIGSREEQLSRRVALVSEPGRRRKRFATGCSSLAVLAAQGVPERRTVATRYGTRLHAQPGIYCVRMQRTHRCGCACDAPGRLRSGNSA